MFYKPNEVQFECYTFSLLRILLYNHTQVLPQKQVATVTPVQFLISALSTAPSISVAVSCKLWFLGGEWGSPTVSHCAMETEEDVQCTGFRYRAVQTSAWFAPRYSPSQGILTGGKFISPAATSSPPRSLSVPLPQCFASLFPWSRQCVASEGSADCRKALWLPQRHSICSPTSSFLSIPLLPFSAHPAASFFFHQYIYLFCSICSVTHHTLLLSVLGMSENFASKGHDAIWQLRHVSLLGLTQHNTHTHTHTHKKTWVFQQSALRFNSNTIPHGAFMSAQLQRLHFCSSFFPPPPTVSIKVHLEDGKKKGNENQL